MYNSVRAIRRVSDIYISIWVENHIDEKYLLDVADELYSYLEAETKTDRRQQIFNMMKYLYTEFAEVQNVWGYDEHQRRYENRFYKINGSPINTDVVNLEGETETPDGGGLYFIGQANFNPFTKEEFYWVKVGQAKNFKARMKQYATHNPNTFKIDFLICHATQKEIDEKELFCNHSLRNFSIGRGFGSNEWYRVDRETYLEMSKKGFRFFK